MHILDYILFYYLLDWLMNKLPPANDQITNVVNLSLVILFVGTYCIIFYIYNVIDIIIYLTKYLPL